MNGGCELGQDLAKIRIEEGEENDATATDRLTSLPDPILHRILCLLDTKSAVQTSVLSRAWRSAWKDLSVLKFGSDSFEQYASFQTYVKKVLSLRHPVGLSVVEFRDKEDPEEGRDGALFAEVIEYARSHGAHSLVIDLINHGNIKPCCVFTALFKADVSNCKLRSLSLEGSIINVELASAGFRMLKELSLTTCLMGTGQKGDFDPFSDLPCLEELFLIQCVFISFFEDDSFTISGPQLHTLYVEVGGYSKINIRAPKVELVNIRHDLRFLNLFDLSLPSLEIADIEIYDKENSMEADKESRARSLMFLFQGLSAATIINLDSITIQILSNIDSAFLEQQPSPFTRLKTLMVVPATVPYPLIDYFLKGSTAENPVVKHYMYRDTP